MQSRWKFQNMAMLIFLTVLLCGCGGGNVAPEQQQASQGSVGGTISVEGAELVSQNGSKVGVRVIEPIIDIDAIEIETSGNTLSQTPVSPGIAKLLQVSLLPAEDLEGLGAASTPVQLNIPLSVEAAQLTNVEIQVSFEQQAASASKTGSQAGRPWFVRLRYTISGPGAVSRHLRIRWAERQVEYDSDLNDNFDNEPRYIDEDRDGLGDDYRGVIDEIASDRPTENISGVIQPNFITGQVLPLVGGPQVHVTENTQITLNGTAVRPGALRAGDELLVRGYAADNDRFLAVEITASRTSDVASRR